ncbi:electron transfer flavoprotein subunit alpha/FixB family protein [Pseudovibrio sp. SPO723]|uniref:electron transfer flavoprotein subunit alpha/FixB family protein n=1 Tax=Nesiotobacter zosterae TaxID=392721 RepID=UPI0029C1E61D|nr:electron transfer flavoprotein subunit alpha/FixB family protein [Pseudovibrio sp. SPO723]MDX5594343.1 electron transfer flavoprotein subunit alpha/FixB family protein [Pseudovibrio sp. SPO723]
MNRALIFIEQNNERLAPELLAVAGQIHGPQPFETYAVVINGDVGSLVGQFDTVISVEDEALQAHDQMALADVVAGLHAEHQFDSIIVAATAAGKMLAPRVAMKINCGLVADVTEISRENDKLRLVRPAYGGRMMAAIEMQGDGPVMLTVRPGVFRGPGMQQNKATQVIEPKGLRYRLGGIRQIKRESKQLSYDIREADVLVSGGGGVARGFELLEPLAKALGGKVAASRAIVDRGLISRSVQVGQSGKTVSPRLYLALGIHGAIQHVVALDEVEYIISVNTNPDAPICSLSDIVVEGDAVIFVEKLLEKIREEQINANN